MRVASQLLLDLEVEPESLHTVPALDEPRLELFGGSMGLPPSEERWSALWEYLVRHSSTEFDLWRRLYDQWKAGDGAFLAVEQETLYSEDSRGQPVAPDPKDLQSHAKAIPLLISAGEELQRVLILLSEGRN